MASNLNTPAHGDHLIVSLPDEAPHTLLLTLNRPKQLNAMNAALEKDLERVLDWFEREKELWVCIVTGNGRAFCAGMDLKEWRQSAEDGSGSGAAQTDRLVENPHGFASLSRRQCRKPIIAAVNGIAFGGGCEIVLNCDLVVAAEESTFALPEVRRGVIAAAGGIPRIYSAAGHHLAAAMMLTGDPVPAQLAHSRYNLVTHLVPSLSALLPTAFTLARSIAACSPDAIQATKHALNLARQDSGIESSWVKWQESAEVKAVWEGENMREGLRAFGEKRPPRWGPAKL